MDPRLHSSTNILRIAIGLMALLAGLDKFVNVLADWDSYVSPIAAQLLPFSTELLMWLVGGVEMAVGIAILTALPALGAYVASAWLLIVAGNLVLAGHFDVAVRDVVLAVAAFTLARLIQMNEDRAAAAQPAAVRHHLIA